MDDALRRAERQEDPERVRALRARAGLPICGHPEDEEPAPGRVCAHLAAGGSQGRVWRLTGEGLRYDLVCEPCAGEEGGELRAMCAACFARTRREGPCLDVDGSRLRVPEREAGLSLTAGTEARFELDGARCLALGPVPRHVSGACLAALSDGRVVRLEPASGALHTLGSLPAWFDPTRELELQVAPGGELAALVEPQGSRGVVLDLAGGEVVLELQRGDYHVNVSRFPLAWIERQGRPLLVHASDWNRLDVTDPRTLERLTARESPQLAGGEGRPAHYLDYFHCGLAVSPDQAWIADAGWVWQPVGIVRAWSLEAWLGGNPWESEDGPTVRDLAESDAWDRPQVFTGPRTLAVWGGPDFEALLPAVCLYDVVTGTELGVFPGPEGDLASDRGRLLSLSARVGLEVWDPDTGQRLLRAPACRGTVWHPGARAVVTWTPEGALRLDRLLGPDDRR